MRSFFKHQRADHLFALFSLILLAAALLSCSSSDTRSQAKSSTSGEFEIHVQIATPIGGAYVAGASYDFSATATGGTGTVTLTWQFTGPTTRTTATGNTVSHTFLESGIHTISVTGVDTRGITGIDTVSINVGGSGSLAVQITSPTNGATVTGSFTFTAVTTGGAGTPTLTWQFFGPTTANTATGTSATFTFFEDGTHTVTVTATDNQGNTATDSITITVNRRFGLSVRITAPTNGATIVSVGGSTNVTFTAVTTGGTGGDPDLTWEIQGPTTQNTATGDSPTITFLEFGVHTVKVTATDSVGGRDSHTITITLVDGS